MEKFQIIDLISDDITINRVKKFCITIYGKNQNNENIACHVINYLPHFYLKVPDNWDTTDSINLLNRACKNCKKNDDNEVIILKSLIRGDNHKSHIVRGKDFYNLSWDTDLNKVKEYSFFKASFTNLGDMKKVITEIRKFYNNNPDSKFKYTSKDQDWINLDRSVEGDKICDSNLYESSLHPTIRFIHDRNIDPTGWVQCEIEDKNVTEIFKDNENIKEFTCKWDKIDKIEDIQTSKYKIASFDIECDSLTGDFPMAKKTFKKLSASIYDSLKIIIDKMPGDLEFLSDVEPLDESDSDDDIIEEKEYFEDILRNLIQIGFHEKKISDCKSYYQYIAIEEIKTKDNKTIHSEFITKIIDEIKNIPDFLTSIQDKKIKNKDRDIIITKIYEIFKEYSIDENDQKIELLGDPIIQIGTVFHDYGTDEWYRNILVIGPEDNMKNEKMCDNLDHLNIDVVHCTDEKDLLIQWMELIKDEDPDFITGYNIFGFDFRYIKDRVDIFFPCPKYASGKDMCNKWGHHDTCPKSEFYNLGKLDEGEKSHRNKVCTFKSQDLNSSALGENKLNYFTMDGRILFDIQKEIEKGHSLDSYKLDNVASHFMRGKLKQIENDRIKVDSIGHLKKGDFISFRLHSNIGEELYKDGKKIKIKKIDKLQLFLEESMDINLDDYHKIEWCLNKDDISPQDIFDKHKDTGPNGAKGRAEVAKYCIQDCELCINLLLLLDIIPNNLAMANVSFVPASYIFLRGQGVKVTSVVTKKCSKRDTRVPELIKIPNLNDYVKMAKNNVSKEDIIQQIIDDSDWRKPNPWEIEKWLKLIMKKNDYAIPGYEGAIVLDPTPGIYLDDPVAVLDYASLYPSSIIEKNISHETYIDDHKLIEQMGWIKDVDYHEIKYDNWIYKGKGEGDTIEKIINESEPIKTCYFLTKEFMEKNNMDSKGIIPDVLSDLLGARSATKKRMKNEPDEFKKKVLDGLQLAYKVTANSVYGQLGAKTSTIFKLELAACTTSVGRSRIEDADNGVKKWAEVKGYPEPEVVYGDTDSVFVKFSRIDKNGKLLEGKEALKHCIQCGIEAGDYITKGELKLDDKIVYHKPLLNKPQDLEYEKTFWPFILISKKRYTGDKYEFEPENPKRTAMGIVLKRRDNAPIVKYTFGHVIEKIMIEKDFQATVQWLKQTLQEIREGKFPISYFVISKSLRGYYKNPQSIAHKVLADRMAERDPGNKPKANDRIPYAYIEVDDKKKIIGHRMKTIKKPNGYQKKTIQIPNGYQKKTILKEDGFYKTGPKKGQQKWKKVKVDDLDNPKYKKEKVDDFENPKFKNIKEIDLNNPIYEKKKPILQGDRIEHIDYIKDKKLKLDYEFYITNQIMNPVKQVLDLELDSNETDKLFEK